MSLKLKKNWLIISFSIILFSLISISIAQAGIFKVKVYHAEYCPRQGAYVRIYNTSFPPKPPYNPIGFCFVTDETGYCQTTAPMAPDWLYKANATWPDGMTLYGETYFTTDEYGNIEGIATIRNSSFPYPDGTEACGDSECDGFKYCYGDGSKYIECDTWDTECDTLDCCQCDGGTQANPAQNYDETQDEDCNPFDIATCFNIPDDYDFTWDYMDSYCTALDTCYQGTITHTCNQPTCGAECDEDPDCVNYCVGETRYYNGDCDLASTCTCSFSTEDCDLQDGCYAYGNGCEDRNYYCTPGNCLYTWQNRNTDSYDSPELYCSANTIRNRTRFHDWYCNGYCTDHESWVNDHLEEDCDAYDDYYDTGNTRWVSTGECTEKEQKEQIWEEWECNSTLPVHCSHYNTTTRWVDTGNTKNKDNGTPCNDGLYCNVGETCQSGICTGGSVRDCSDSVSCTVDTCDEVNDECDNTPDDGLCPTDTVCADYYCDQQLDCQVSYEPDTTVCRASAGICDIAENCDGINVDCPSDVFKPLSIPCEADGQFCTVDHCDGYGSCVCLGPYDCSGNDITGIATCTNNPDAIPFTWDYRETFTSVCNEVLDECSTGDSTITHTCDKTQCGAECETDDDCTEGICRADCTCGVWEEIFTESEYPIIDIEEYNNKLYFANHKDLYIFDGSTWNNISTPVSIPSLQSYDGKLYVAGGPGKVYSYDGTWTEVFNVDEPNTVEYLLMLGVYNNKLYAGNFLDQPARLYYCSDSCDITTNWHEDIGFANILYCPGAFCSIDSMEVYNGKMYVGSGGKVYENDGTWSIIKDYTDVYAYMDMKVYNGKLYLATRDLGWKCPLYQGNSGFCGRILEFDGTNWVESFVHDGTGGYWVFSLEEYNGRLYAGTANKIYMYDGIEWELSITASLETVPSHSHSEGNNTPCMVLKTWNNKIYAGWGNGVIFKDDMIEPIEITILSPEDTTYTTNSVDLTFTINRPVSWVGYNLDKQENVTITGSTTLTNLADGLHSLAVYATDDTEMTGYSEVHFTVSMPKQPDLIVEDIWTSGNSVYYKIKNQGNADVRYSYSRLYVDGYYRMYDYVSSLSAGSSSNEYFYYSWYYTWSCSGSSDTIKVCTDDWGFVSESDEKNNCRTETVKCSESVKIEIQSPKSCTDYTTCTEGYYYKVKIPLEFTVEPNPDWIGYSLNKQPYVTITGSTTLSKTELIDKSLNSVTVLAKKGSADASETIQFFYCLGDMNYDRVIDISDVMFVASLFGRYCGDGRYNDRADMNDDCRIDMSDISVVSREFGKIC